MKISAGVVSHMAITVNGVELPKTILPNLLDVVVEQHAYLPAIFTLRFRDPGLQLLDEGPFAFLAPVEIAGKDQNNKLVTLISGEITAIEPEFNAGMSAELVVYGSDLTQRLYREIKSTTYLNVKDSDLATQFAQTAGLAAEVEATKTVYDHLYQHNQSDLHFLMQRAWRIGYECYVANGKLIFRRPKPGAAQVTLTWGDDLLSFRPRIALAEQVEEVLVKGWDVQKKSALIGRADQGIFYPNIGDQTQRDAQQGGKLVIVDQPVVSQSEAEILAMARFNELSGAYIEAEGEAYRRPELCAGCVIKLKALGKRFSGDYWITSAIHTYTSSGFRTRFAVRGSRTGLLTEQLNGRSHLDRWPGVAPAIVTNTDDPKRWGRVKVKYPWLSDEDESDWARVVSAGGGPEAGFCLTPAIDDEVLVAFVHGDFGQPVVVGGLWNGKDALAPPTATAPEGEKPLVRTWHSRTGHAITMYDNADNKVVIQTKSGHAVTLDDAQRRISLITAGNLAITLADEGKEIEIKAAGGKVTVKADNEVQVEATGNLRLKAGGNLQLEATGNLEMKAVGGATLQGAARVAIQAPQISLG